MKKYKLLVDYEIIDINGVNLAIFKNGGDSAFVVNEETSYMLSLLKEEKSMSEMQEELAIKYKIEKEVVKPVLITLIRRLQENQLIF